MYHNSCLVIRYVSYIFRKDKHLRNETCKTRSKQYYVLDNLIICATPTQFLSNYLERFQLFMSRAENSIDPDQLASEKPADLDLHCFQRG